MEPLAEFTAARAARWDELDAGLAQARGKADRLGPQGALRLGALYRATAADLAIMRRRYPDDPAIGRLESLVLRARSAIYADEPGRGTLRSFFATGYWRRVAERPVPLLLAVLLMFGPLGLALAWGLDDPAAAVGIVPDQFQGAATPGDRPDIDLSPGENAAFASEILTNNIQVSFLAFAGGLLLGLGTAATLIFNGGFVGAIIGLALGGGDGEQLFRLIVPHGVLELSIICVAGCAGLRMGWAIVEPGTRTRGASLRREARRAIEIILGTMPWFVVAGIVEGFVTPENLPLAAALLVGVSLGAIYWMLVVWRGYLPTRRERRADRAAAAAGFAAATPAWR